MYFVRQVLLLATVCVPCYTDIICTYCCREFTNDGSVIDMTKHRLNKVLRRLPSKGDFEIDSVLKSVYFFS